MLLAVACNRSSHYQASAKGLDDEFEEFDSPETVEAIAETIRSFGHEVDLLEADASFPVALTKRPYQFVFNISEGLHGRGRESQVPCVCEMLGIPYSGSDGVTMGVTLDKDLAKRAVTGTVPVAQGRVFNRPSDLDFEGMTFPLLLKPNAEGSSKGIRNACRVTTPAEARERATELLGNYHGGILAEEFLPGVECTIGVLGNETPRVIGMMEITPRNVKPEEFVYSLEIKRDYLNQVEYHVPPRLPATTRRKMEELALGAFRALQCRDFARVDVRLDAKGEPRFIEVNPLPGLSPVKGDLVILSKAAGLEYRTLIGEILDHAFRRTGLRTGCTS